ncbi:restriction endonuclease subunit S [Runella slithyformis]|uniref:Restriction modification system DNA specificity domain protein n=1 Tax=Runella slithyformis (strain ATCC 29530 / DSM 19594 / LMG 11500 / NCIMB 11436 / LSU 4) TaxID=761193 RepID=A0A7U3ZP45_RUNSL|nr:restriction endonuclease subunit S [Runella slithyformis]AEI50787.1 restriction modification system DNA specificity domain protein [Runella slithyformis DSM 19594]
MQNNLLKYNHYKPSGVQWLGDIPEHWEVTFVKHLLSIPITDGPHTTPELLDEGIPFISAEAIKNGEIDFEKKRGFISLKDHLLFSKKYSPRKGDIYMVKSGATTGNVAMVKTNNDFSIWSPLAVFRAEAKKITPEYLHLFLQSYTFRKGVELSWSFGTQQNIGMGILSNLPVTYGSIAEQTVIAQFLDRKTAQIEVAITQKQRMIELLKERRQILIHQAVTRGLNPDVPMKDSGVEWIGEIPEHWEVKRLRHIGQCQNGVSKGAEYFGSGYPFISYGDVYKNIELPKTVNGLAESSIEDRKYYSVEEGDVLFTRTSETAEEIGFASTCLSTIENSTFAGFLIRFRPKQGALFKGFSKYYFSSKTHRAFFVKEMNLVIRASLSQELLRKMPILIPPIKEQIEIYNYLETATQKMDKAIGLKEQEIEKLKEYKASLINSVVTGKVKVIENPKGVA